MSAPAHAQGTRVTIVRSPDATPVLREATTRLLAELSAAGFDAVEVEAPDIDPRAATEETGEGGLATLVLRSVGRGAAIDVWIADSLTHKTSVRRVQVAARGKSGAPKVIALHAVELLRASLLEAASPPKQEEVAPVIAPVPLPPAVEKLVAPEPSPPPPPEERRGTRFGLEVAAALLQGFQAIGTAPAPMVAGSISFRDHVSVRIALVGPGFGADVTTATGSATIRQELTTLEIAYALLPRDTRVVPRLVLGGGAYHLHARGSASPPYHATSADTWSALADAGLGVSFRLGTHAELVADARALFLFPRPVVAIADAPPSSTGRPSLLASFGVLASF
jgi:hypothetical protein